MNIKDAKEYIEQYSNEDGSIDEQGLIEMILSAYERGRDEGYQERVKEVY